MNDLINRLGERVLTVSQFNAVAKAVLENEPLLKGVCVIGEISGFKRYPSGHLYFSVKDAGSALSCVMFQSSAAALKFLPADGMKVRIYGAATIYEKDGRYQFMVRRMLPDGIGGLWAAYEALKKKLESEGLFAPERKKKLPPFPRRIGVITSIAGAALHDILSVTGRRCPSTEIYVFPSAVQGSEAPAQLCRAVRWFSEKRNVDLLIIGRGGGSLEDLWAFNDETLARTLAACPIPTISAVGHETDFTVCDFVCDRRAPTPSAAAEIALPDRNELLLGLAHLSARMENAATGALQKRAQRLNALAASPVLRDPGAGVKVKKQFLEALGARFASGGARQTERRRARIEQISGKMLSLNPLAVLSRGYSAVFDGEGKVVRSARDVKKGDTVDLRFADGRAQAEILKVRKDHG